MIPVVFYHLENYDPHLILQELGRYKINVIPRKIEQYMSFIIEIDKIINIGYVNSLVF